MVLKSDIRDLPKRDRTTTWPTLFRDVLADHLVALRAEGDATHVSSGARIKTHWAGRCARQVGYLMAGLDEPDRPASALWTFAMGDRGHELIQGALTRRFGSLVVHEAKMMVGERISLADSVLTFPEPTELAVGAETVTVTKVVFEYKTTGGFGWSKMVKEEGPKVEAYLQGAMAAVDHDADLLVIVYLTKDNQPQTAKMVYGAAAMDLDEVMASWVYRPDEYTADGLLEAARLADVLSLVTAGELPPRSMPGLPDGARIVNPATGLWNVVGPDGQMTESGSAWQCRYCPFADRCSEDG